MTYLPKLLSKVIDFIYISFLLIVSLFLILFIAGIAWIAEKFGAKWPKYYSDILNGDCYE